MKAMTTMNIKRSYKNPTKFFVAIALVITCMKNPGTIFAQDGTQQTKVATPIKVMSFNIRYGAAKDGENHWKNRSYLVAETIQLFDPDLLGAQEVLKFQAEFLQETLPDYGFHGVGREDGTAKGEYVPVMYKKDRFQMTGSGHFWLSDTPEVAGSKSWDSSLPRMVSWVQLNDLKNNGAKLIFLNTHFDHRGPTARLESARLIRKRAEEIMGKGIPFIITGDFNTTEDKQPYAELTSGSKGNKTPIVDSFRQANPKRNPNESTSSRWVGRREGTRIDWILHSQAFTTLQSVINYTHEGERYPSDHYPVQAIVRMKN
jgi:endonuclease/exonuclease/phosphatase family metal-dependent hydrolase